jgi:lipopolysaccharide cholinephosphotransferase
MINRDELKKKYNPEGSELRNLQYKLLDALLVIDKICKQNNIKYFLTGGTLLGAVRHNGFIPWDDDLDIGMLKKEYKKLVKILQNYNDDKYILQCQKSDYNYVLVFPKFREKEGNYFGSFPPRGRLYKYKGPAVDIFCVEEISEITAKLSTIYHNLLLDKTYLIKNAKLRFFVTKILFFVYKTTVPLFHVFDVFKKRNEAHNGMGMGFADKYQYINNIEPYTKVVFENHEFPAPYNYDSFLTDLYGDWRKIPNKDNIEIHNQDFKQ